MSLIKCPECNNSISDKSLSCPKCGLQITSEVIEKVQLKEKVAKKTKGIGCLVIIAIVIIISVVNSISERLEEKKPKTSEEIRKEKVEKYFSSWDGSHTGLTKLIKSTMHDPDSYEHVETKYWNKGEYLIVETKFRGKNAFGGIVANSVTAKVDLNGNVLDVISQE